jgi:Flp pilus assembly protein TadD
MDAAIVRFEEAVERRPGYPEALHNLTGSLLQEGRIEEAVEVGERAVAAAPGDPGTHHLLALAYEAAGDAAGARRESERAVELAPDSTEFRRTRDRIARAIRED